MQWNRSFKPLFRISSLAVFFFMVFVLLLQELKFGEWQNGYSAK